MFAVLAVALLSSAYALPQVPVPVPAPLARYNTPFVPIVSQSFDSSPDGSYAFQYTSADGSARQESGVLKNPGTVAEANSVTGSYTYVADDGTPVTVNYIADENGFQPEGTSVDPAITRSVAAQVQEAAAVRAGVVPAPIVPAPIVPAPIPARVLPRPVAPVPVPAPIAPINPYYNPAVYRGYPGYAGYPGYNPYYNAAYPQRVFPAPVPVVAPKA